MTTARAIVRSTFFISFSGIAAKILAFIIAIYLARYLGVEEFGKYNFIISYFLLFGFIAGFGLDSVVIRDISKNPAEAQRTMGNALVIRIITSFLAIFLANILIYALKTSNDTIFYIRVTSLILLAQGLSYLFESLFQAKIKMEYAAISIVVPKFMYLIATFYLISRDAELIQILFIYVLSEFMRTLISFFYSNKVLQYNMQFDQRTFKSLLQKSLPFVVGYGLLVLYNRFDILMLSIMQGDIAVGYYAAAYRITESVLFVPGALAATLMPIMAKHFDCNKKKIEYMYELGTKYILMLILPIITGGLLLGDEIIFYIYGSDFFNSIFVFKVLTLTILFNSLISIQSALLVAANKQQLNNISISLCAIINVLLNLIMIPKYSYVGAGVATLLSVICLYILSSYFILRHIQIHSIKLMFMKYIFASIVMGIVLTTLNIHLLIKIALGFILYIILVFFLKGFNRNDIELLKNKK